MGDDGAEICQSGEDEEKKGEYTTDKDEELSPMFNGGKIVIEVFQLVEDEDALSPVEMGPEKLQIKHDVTKVEIQQLKQKLQSLEQKKEWWEVKMAQLQQSVEENKEQMEKLEGY
ncbi:hypothetical protein STEG23_020219 [Scotinomys teguina]